MDESNFKDKAFEVLTKLQLIGMQAIEEALIEADANGYDEGYHDGWNDAEDYYEIENGEDDND